MVAGVFLDLTLDVGLWAIGKLGKGLLSLAYYALGSYGGGADSTAESPPLAICGPNPVADSLDAAATLRTSGVLDDTEYVRVVRDLVVRGVHEDKRGLPPTARPTSSAPTAPPAYEAYDNGKLNLDI